MLAGKAGDIWGAIEPVVAGLGYELVDMDYLVGGFGGGTLRLYIDFPSGQMVDPTKKITVDDCALVSEPLGIYLDQVDLIPHQYILEVSSPGMERRVRREADFLRFCGREVQVELLNRLEGRRKARGFIRQVADGMVQLELQEGGDYSFPLDQLKRAHLVFDFDALFQEKPRAAGKDSGKNFDKSSGKSSDKGSGKSARKAKSPKEGSTLYAEQDEDLTDREV